jgi:hypothetical protein
MSKLNLTHVRGNSFTGMLPKEQDALPVLPCLDTSSNALSGSNSSKAGRLALPGALVLIGNQLSGSPADLWQLGLLVKNALLTATIPPKVGQWPSSGSLSGATPTEIGMTVLEAFTCWAMAKFGL